MKKLDKLVLKAFIGPFILTFLVVVFILLMQHMLKYFDDIIGKDLGTDVVAQLLFYFAIFMTPVALPLAVLLSSLISFGNLGEHFELTAIKSAGVSLLRTLQPIFFVVLILTGVAFYANNTLVPAAALEAYSLLYDIKQKKPALELKEGTFYNGIPDISIKVNQKFSSDDAALKDIIVYDHTKNNGNKEVTVADSGRMSTILNERYLKFELFNGYNYTEGASTEREMTGQGSSRQTESFTRSKFNKTEVVFDLSSYDLKRTDKKWFEGNRIMRNLKELNKDIDSIQSQVLQQKLNYYTQRSGNFMYLQKEDSLILPAELYAFKAQRDSLSEKSRRENKQESVSTSDYYIQKAERQKELLQRGRLKKKKAVLGRLKQLETQRDSLVRNDADSAVFKRDSAFFAAIDSIYLLKPRFEQMQSATNMARQVKSQIENSNTSVDLYEKEVAVFQIQWNKIIASSLACVAMFLIGAPLGAIIKRGGLGVPFLVSIFFFIIYYVLTMQGEKLAKQESIAPWIGVWAADLILLLIGGFFLRQARIDARLFEADFYSVAADKVKKWVVKRWKPASTT